MHFHIFPIMFSLNTTYTWHPGFAPYNLIFTRDGIVKAFFHVFFNCFHLSYPFTSNLFILTVYIKALNGSMNLHSLCNFKETATNGASLFPFSRCFFNARLTKCVITTLSFIRVLTHSMTYFTYKHIHYLTFHKSVMITTLDADLRHYLYSTDIYG